MFGFLLAISLSIALILLVEHTEQGAARSDMRRLLLLAYGVRVFLCTFVNEVPLFSYGSGGDCDLYEEMALGIVRYWDAAGLQFIGIHHPIVVVGNAPLPLNLFAAIIWLNRGATRIGCTAPVAIAAVVSCYNLYRLALELGTDKRRARLILIVQLFSPGFLFYTSNMYKDGLVMLFVLSAVASAFRLARSYSVTHLVIGVVSLACLWLTRFYMVFLVMAPLIIGLAGLRSKSIWRPILATTAIAVVGLVMLQFSTILQDLEATAESTFEHATDWRTLSWNGRWHDPGTQTSGVRFDDGGKPFGAFHQKLAYTLFAPFPWAGGSMALQIAKLDALVWYYMAYRAWVSAKLMFKRRDVALLLMFLVFIVPTTIAYAATVSNVGLIVRQRIPIVMLTTLLAGLSWPQVAAAAILAPAASVAAAIRRRRGDPLVMAARPGSRVAGPIWETLRRHDPGVSGGLATSGTRPLGTGAAPLALRARHGSGPSYAPEVEDGESHGGLVDEGLGTTKGMLLVDVRGESTNHAQQQLR